MLERFLKTENLVAAFPYIVGGALFLWMVLFVVHCVRLFHRSRSYNCSIDKKIARETIKHENELLNHRLTWLLTSEGLLFTALGFALSKDDAHLGRQLIPALSFVGVLLAASASIVLDAADAAIIKHSPKLSDTSDDVIGYRGLPWVGLLSPWRVYPPMLIVAWYMISQIN